MVLSLMFLIISWLLAAIAVSGGTTPWFFLVPATATVICMLIGAGVFD